MTLEAFLVRVALPTIVLLSLIEAAVLSRRMKYDWKGLGVSLVNLVARSAALVLLPVSVAGPVFGFVWAHRLTTISLDTWQAVALLFVGQEFCYYWYHRASHRVRWFWASHSVHHSPNQLNMSAAYRIAVFGKLAGGTFFFVPMVWLGFAPSLVVASLALNLSYQFWIHAAWIPKLGWLEYVLNTPSAHRVHHASNLEYLDANYGGVLIIFDRLFGTYVEERADVPCRYGLVHPQTSYNPLRIEFDQWLSLARDLLKSGSVKSGLALLAMPPGWRVDGPGETTEELRARSLRTDPLPSDSTPLLGQAR